MILKVHFTEKQAAALERFAEPMGLRTDQLVHMTMTFIVDLQDKMRDAVAAAQGRPNLRAVAGGAKPKRRRRRPNLRAVQ